MKENKDLDLDLNPFGEIPESAKSFSNFLLIIVNLLFHFSIIPKPKGFRITYFSGQYMWTKLSKSLYL